MADETLVKLVGYGTLSEMRPKFFPLVRVTKTMVVIRVNNIATWRFRRKDGHQVGIPRGWSGWELAKTELAKYAPGKEGLP